MDLVGKQAGVCSTYDLSHHLIVVTANCVPDWFFAIKSDG